MGSWVARGRRAIAFNLPLLLLAHGVHVDHFHPRYADFRTQLALRPWSLIFIDRPRTRIKFGAFRLPAHLRREDVDTRDLNQLC